MRPTSRISLLVKRIDKFLQTIVLCLFTIMFTTIGLPLLVIVGFTFFVNRQLVILLAKIFKRSTLTKPVTLLSSSMANMDLIYTKPFNVLVTCMILEGIPDMEKIRLVVKTQMLEKIDPKTGRWYYPEIFQNIGYWMSYPFWRKLKNVNTEWFLKECVHFYQDDGQIQSNFHMLENIITKLAVTPFSKQGPLIDCIIIPNYTPHPEKNPGLTPDKLYFALIHRTHHALADGYAAFRVAQNMSITAQPDKFEYISPNDYTHQSNVTKNSIIIKLCKNAALLFTMLYELTKFIFMGEIVSSENSVWPKHNKDALLTSASPISTTTSYPQIENLTTAQGNPFDISEIKAIRQIHNVTGTAVLFSAIIGAARKALFKSGAALPSYIGISITLPLPGHSGKFRNRNTVGMIYIPFSESDPIKRLHKVQKELHRLKRSTLPVALAFVSAPLIGNLPRWAYPMKEKAKEVEVLSITNMVGPSIMFDLAGYPIRDFHFTTGIPMGKNFPFFGLVSVGGRVRLSVAANPAIVSSEQSQQLMSAFFQELELLRDGGNTSCV